MYVYNSIRFFTRVSFIFWHHLEPSVLKVTKRNAHKNRIDLSYQKLDKL